MKNYQKLTREDLCELLPHSGAMCLVDKVTYCDQLSIRVISAAHLSLAHPLRQDNKLSCLCFIEIAAQAIALQSAILTDEPMGEGYLTTLRNIRWTKESIKHIPTAIHIEATLLTQDPRGIIVTFKAFEFSPCPNEHLLASGKLSIMKKPIVEVV